MTKGAFFSHFGSKEARGVAAAEFWADTTSAFFEATPYHLPDDPLYRVLAYVASRKAIIVGELAEFTCLVGTMAQEVGAGGLCNLVGYPRGLREKHIRTRRDVGG